MRTVDQRSPSAVPRAIALVAALLLVALLFLDWQSSYGVGRAGWSGAGWIAGGAALVVVVWELTRRVGAVVEQRGPDRFGAAAALVAVIAVVVKLLRDDAARTGVAWVGLVVAAVLAVAALAIALRPGADPARIEDPPGGRRPPKRRKAPPLRTRR